MAQSPDYSSYLPDEIFSFFDKNFNFNSWKWDDEHLFWQYYNNFYPSSIDYHDAVIYIDNPDKKNRLIESISWLINTLQDEHSSEKEQKIAFELTYLLPKFWAISYEEGIIFSQSSKNLAIRYLSHLKIELSTLQNASINDNERMDSLTENLENERWKELAEDKWHLNELYNHLSLNFHQSYSFISEHYDYEILSLINQETKVFNLLYWLALLPEKYRQPFVLQTTKNLAKFLLLFELDHLSRNEMKDEQIQLSDIWEDCPNEWFDIFNQYPVRYPSLQLGFGAFLTNATDEKIRIYIDSLQLNQDEAHIKECLAYFFDHADEHRVRYLCKLAYEKWEGWNFGDSYSIARSVLDSALVKYFQIMLPKQDRENFIQNEINQILNFQQEWFASIVELDKFVYLHLSRIQPACIVEELEQDSSLSFEDIQKRVYFPAQFDNDLRWRNWIHLDKFN
ncbi:hypothetical protein [Haemophilus parainfluenzae]|uniref:hypothetical protein n=1 Tax=Haemophilus parainfluenzae TaxID=729 RepID=UPI000FFEFB99|nr:hypothetical protein [Haemophilus parainfluenzae]KAB1992270.1 hypothetical protein F8M38_03635 [Haemophilus parainfluenzae]MBS6187921.1 hypothetical protein [Haemophilus parainfluenzae]MDU4896136.1 hypothetical protein [Haemophilus parainfluenzae]MDU6706682.1 hypothetical protein [Haemophilus parainfluenzae]QAT94611.1 hypothetical protein ERO09_00765 [Haemophilus parainfluenzae]